MIPSLIVFIKSSQALDMRQEQSRGNKRASIARNSKKPLIKGHLYFVFVVTYHQ